MTTITNYNGNGIIEELVLSTNDVAALTVIPEYAAVIEENFTGSDNDTDNGSDNNTETATIKIPVEVEETIAGGAYVNVNATTLDKYIAIYRQGDIFMKRGMALKMVAVALIEQSELYYDKGYGSITEFAAKEFNLAEQTTRQYLQTAKKFYDIPALSEKFDVEDLVDENGNVKKSRQVAVASIFADTSTGKDFSANSLIAIRALKVDTIKELIDSGELNYEMTGAEIKQAVAPYRKRAGKKASGAETDNDTATDTGSENVNDVEIDNGSDTKDTVAMALETIEQLQAKLAAAQAEIQALTAKNDALQTENERLIQRYNNREKQLQAEITKEFLAAEKLKAENDILTAENKTLKASVNSYKAANTKAKKLNDTLKTELETLKGCSDNDVSSDTETPVTITGSGNDTGSETDNDATAE